MVFHVTQLLKFIHDDHDSLLISLMAVIRFFQEFGDSIDQRFDCVIRDEK